MSKKFVSGGWQGLIDDLLGCRGNSLSFGILIDTYINCKLEQFFMEQNGKDCKRFCLCNVRFFVVPSQMCCVSVGFSTFVLVDAEWSV